MKTNAGEPTLSGRNFRLADPEFLHHPAPMLGEMRKAGPLVPVKFPMIGTILVTTNYAATEEVMKGKDRFMLERRNAGGRGGPAGIKWWMPKGLRLLANNMLARDDPQHRRLRALVDKAFRRQGMLQMAGNIGERADRLLDDWDGAREAELVADYARRLPAEVIADLLGVSQEVREQFIARAAQLADTSNTISMVLSILRIGSFVKDIRQIIDNARMHPRPGLISQLIEIEEGGDRLSEDELIAMVFLLLFAGMETTTNLISGSVVALENNPAQKRWLLDDPEARAETAVEELARYVSSITGTKPRYAAHDTSVQGKAIKQGQAVMALPAAANYDPAVFDEPDSLRLDRSPNPHLSFSTGNHFCLGLQLAKVETRQALVRLYARYPDLTLAAPDRLEYQRRDGHRALKQLPVRPYGG